ncbi:D-alanyl-D-alanine carboxypeptidase [Brucella sp. 191011898]|uniref:D-alanyl-D-alanine carboxypeptidase n=1 Tax=Brucella sp. 191011898 TaxID=2730447 RepID=UPI0017691651|nr:D-alanyl-D-alanine carboxypeptidase [Brucella sp. 191011898]CAB4327070.1 D-alanyl-D-alanine carboxypeptidase [Brucella sp. 191011898]
MLKSSSRISRFFASVAFGTAVLCASGAMANTSWVVFDADSGRMLGQDDASAQHAPASLAKMMTLYLTFEALKTGRLHWDDALPISKNAASKVRMKLWLKAGDTISTRDAVNGMIIVSANDAATVMGEYLAGSEAAFARLMTQRARQIGMKSTIFANPSGLTANVSQLTTARDMAVLGMALRRDFPEEYALFSQRSFTFRGRVYNGHNNLMYRYAGVDGIKTGYTNVSGYNLVSSAYINNKHLVGVVLGAGSAGQRDGQMAKLLTRFGGVDNGKAAPLVAMAKPQAVAAKQKPDVVADLIDDTQIEQGDGGYPVASGKSNWRIQLAATPSRAGASELQEKYAPVVSRIVPGAKGEISPSPKGRKVYRVRFSGVRDSAAASKACAQLKRQQIACLAIQN